MVAASRLVRPLSRAQWQRPFASVLVDGIRSEPLVSVHDLTFIRGDGAFDVVSLLPSPADTGVGVPVGLRLHLDRLDATCRSARLGLPHSLNRIESWVKQLGRESGPGSCRIVITRGQPLRSVEPKCLLIHDAPQTPSTGLRLQSMEAPWHMAFSLPRNAAPTSYSDKLQLDAWKTIKWMSYAPNCLATRLAGEQGADDALLVTNDGRILDGPNFAVGFVIGGTLRFVCANTHRMLPSCTQVMAVRAAREAGLPVEESSISLEEAMAAPAGFVMSATRHVTPILSLDGTEKQSGNALLCDLQAAYWRHLSAEIDAET